MLKLDKVVVTPLMENCYILHNNSEAIIFDPGGDFDKIDAFLKEKELKIHSILNTHAHFDHIGAVGEIQNSYKTKFYLHENDLELLLSSPSTAALYGWRFVTEPTLDGYLEDNQIIEFAGSTIKVIHTPGHTMGCVSFLIEPENILITGDTIFHESIGRTDLEQSDHPSIIRSIKERIYTLNEDITIYPGHGLSTSIKHEKRYNPFVQA